MKLLKIEALSWLTKRAVISGRNWKRRYFVLSVPKRTLAYYDISTFFERSASVQERPGRLNLPAATVLERGDRRGYCRSIRVRQRRGG